MANSNTENSNTNEKYKIVLNLSQRLDIKSSNENVALQNLSIYYTWENVRKQYKNNKLKILALTWYGEFESPNRSYSVSDVQDYVKYIIKKQETLITIPPFHVYINRTNNRIVLKIKDGYKLQPFTKYLKLILVSM